MSFFLAFAGFAALIVLHELGHFAAAKAVGMRVERFALFFPPILAKVRRGETEYGIGAIPLGGYVKISGMNPREELPAGQEHRAYFRQPVWKRIVVIAAGPLVNVVVAFMLIWGLLAVNGADTANLAVERVERGSPAAAAGLRPGDRILAIEGRPIFEPGLSARQRADRQQRFIDATRAADGPVRIRVERDGAPREVTVGTFYDAERDVRRVGVSFGIDEDVPIGAGEAASESVRTMWNVTTLTVTAIVKLFYDSEARKEVSGVVGSYETTRQAITFDTALAIQVLALISLSLAVVNLFPFLPLDGGHIFWALAEKVRGRRFSFEVMERASVVGFVLVMFLFAIGLTNDIGRLAGEGFQLR